MLRLHGRYSLMVMIAGLAVLSGCDGDSPSSGGPDSPRVSPSGSPRQGYPAAASEQPATTPDVKAIEEDLAELAGQVSSDEVKAVAMVFVLPDCPMANAYSAEFNRLNAEFLADGVPLVLIHIDPDLTEEAMRVHAREYQITCPVILDGRQVWAERAGATKSPEAAIFARDGRLLYRGRIDDRYVAVGKRRHEVTSRDLHNALAAVAAGLPVPQPRTLAIGCDIPEPSIQD